MRYEAVFKLFTKVALDAIYFRVSFLQSSCVVRIIKDSFEIEKKDCFEVKKKERDYD